MVSPSEEAALRDELCVTLLEATSHPDALSRARREERGGITPYDEMPRYPAVTDRRLANRARTGIDVLDCTLCGRAFTTAPGRGARIRFGLTFCSEKCAMHVQNLRYRRGLVA